MPRGYLGGMKPDHAPIRRSSRVSVPEPPADHQRGFTLIELMIVLVVAAILAAIALPAMSEYMLRGKLASATASLREAAQRMENFYADNRSYAATAGGGTCAVQNFTDTSSQFTFACVLQSAGQGFRFDAIGTGGSAGFRYRIREGGQEQTVTLPAGWNGAGQFRFVLRKE